MSDQKYQKSYKRRSTSYISPPCRLAATGANKVPRPSRYSLAAATGSKRSSADSDSLLCHVRLWRTSRFRFGCVSGCEHSEMGFILIIPSAYLLHPRPPCTFSGRADNACTNLLGFLVRYVRTRGIDEAMESDKATDFCFILCCTHSPRTARATNSCTPPVIRKEDGASPPC